MWQPDFVYSFLRNETTNLLVMKSLFLKWPVSRKRETSKTTLVVREKAKCGTQNI
jgi:hypothetical protein